MLYSCNKKPKERVPDIFSIQKVPKNDQKPTKTGTSANDREYEKVW